MAKPNYHHARQQRERARKARQQEKLQRRTAHDAEPTANSQPNAATVTPAEPGQARIPFRPHDKK